jgi:ElaB/YqjD/DUF883 family membrane-anchored ribosome-binding protein
MTEKTVAAAHRSIDALGERASKSEQALRNAAASSAGKCAESQEYLRSQMNTSLERTRTYMREHPIMAAGTAFAAGALLTALLSSRR